MSREWKPGDVALVKSRAGRAACVAVRTESNTWRCEHGPTIDEKVEWIRPLVAIDVEDREQVERLLTSIPLRDRIEGVIRCSIDDRTFARIGDHFQAALREFANPTPPKPEVYSHVVVDIRHGIASALCGKVWEPGADATVVGKCPECDTLAGTWTS